MEIRKELAIKSGLSFQAELIKQSKIPLTGATHKLREDIEAIDPKAWETICYFVADNNIALVNQWLAEQGAVKRIEIPLATTDGDDWDYEYKPLRIS